MCHSATLHRATVPQCHSATAPRYAPRVGAALKSEPRLLIAELAAAAAVAASAITACATVHR